MTQCPANIAILLATYNGEQYLQEQIDSLFAQTFLDWHLYVHDDGSKDNTVNIVKDYSEKFPHKVTLMDYPPQGGACKNFLSMLEHVDSKYYMFCDQDDIWLPNKIEIEHREILRNEIIAPGIPIMINTDLTIIDEKQNVLHNSLRSYQDIYPSFIKQFKDLSALSSCTGSTMLFNKKAKDSVKHPYQNALMHDQWVALCVLAAKGKIIYMPESTVLYRQHDNNVLGAMEGPRFVWMEKIKNFRYITRVLRNHYKQMNSIARVSWFDFIVAKIRYRRYINSHTTKK